MLRKLIRHLPYVIKKPIRILYSYIPDKYKYGREFRKTYAFLQESQFWNKEKLKNYQLEQLHKIIHHAYNNVAYYRKIFDERGLKPENISNFTDLKKLPYLTKDIIGENLEMLVADNYDKARLKKVTTGGTTGMPMVFYQEEKNYIREWAFITNLWKRVGYDINKVNRMVVLRNNIPKHGYYEYLGKDLILSSFQLNNVNFMEYIIRIKKFNPDFIYGYPSAIAVLSKYILDNGIKIELSKIKAVLCGSENIYDYQRKMIEKAFNCRVYSWYGHSEICILAGECEKSSLYHIASEYGYAELINNKGEDAVTENELCEIVATSFNNYAMPFIRYKTCDIAVNTIEGCKCERNCKMIKRINGREQEFFVDKTNSLVIFTSADRAIWNVKDKVISYQYIQDEPGKVTLNINTKSKLNNEDLISIIDNFHKFYPTIDIALSEIDNIPRTETGKFKYLIQNLNITFSDD